MKIILSALLLLLSYIIPILWVINYIGFAVLGLLLGLMLQGRDPGEFLEIISQMKENFYEIIKNSN